MASVLILAVISFSNSEFCFEPPSDTQKILEQAGDASDFRRLIKEYAPLKRQLAELTMMRIRMLQKQGQTDDLSGPLAAEIELEKEMKPKSDKLLSFPFPFAVDLLDDSDAPLFERELAASFLLIKLQDGVGTQDERKTWIEKYIKFVATQDVPNTASRLFSLYYETIDDLRQFPVSKIIELRDLLYEADKREIYRKSNSVDVFIMQLESLAPSWKTHDGFKKQVHRFFQIVDPEAKGVTFEKIKKVLKDDKKLKDLDPEAEDFTSWMSNDFLGVSLVDTSSLGELLKLQNSIVRLMGNIDRNDNGLVTEAEFISFAETLLFTKTATGYEWVVRSDLDADKDKKVTEDEANQKLPGWKKTSGSDENKLFKIDEYAVVNGNLYEKLGTFSFRSQAALPPKHLHWVA